MTIRELRSELDQRKGRRDQIQRNLEEASTKAREQKQLARRLEKVQTLFREVALRTQQQLEIQISGLVSMALAAVFPEPYELVLRFEQRRNKTEADLLFKRNDLEIDPLSAAGGGVVDVAAFALRIALWRISSPKPAALIVLDEPFKHLSEGLQPKASALLKELSRRLGVQFLMVTHNEELIEEADKIFRVRIRNGVSLVGEEVKP